jgi:hypothetical protein
VAYVYRHIRLDKNVPFYIGIGSDNLYKRAYIKSRSKHWKSITKKTKYEVEIVLDNLSWEEACEKEKEFIKLYGRTDKNEGTLVNKTDGGEGSLGAIRNLSQEVEEERRKKIAQANVGRIRTDLTRYNKSRSGTNHPYYGKSSPKKGKKDKKASERANKKTECPHCNKIGQVVVMKRWHFENCKTLRN